MILTIIICTHNRSHLLKRCLDAIVLQLKDDVEVIVVDNNSTDSTSAIVESFSKHNRNIRYVFESEIGLSYARNLGWQQAKSDWVLYIDDDAKAFPDLVERARDLIYHEDFDCVGGMYYGYYDGEKPRWIPAGFGDKEVFAETLSECPYQIPAGGVILYRKKLLNHLNGFDVKYGMSGSIKSLGEETELNFRAQGMGYKIGFDPELKIWHLVKKEYLTVHWMLKRKYLVGQFNQRIEKKGYFRRLILLTRSIMGAFFVRIPRNTVKLLNSKQYYHQNWIIDVWQPVSLRLGQLCSGD